MLSTVGLCLRRGPKTREMISFLRLSRPTLLHLPSAQCLCTRSPSLFCAKEPPTHKEEFGSELNVCGQQRDADNIGSVIKERVPQIREAALQVKDGVRHLKGEVDAENPQLYGESRISAAGELGDPGSQKPSNQSKEEDVGNSEALEYNSDFSQLPDE